MALKQLLLSLYYLYISWNCFYISDRLLKESLNRLSMKLEKFKRDKALALKSAASISTL